MEPLKQSINIPTDHGLLISHGLFREPVGHLAAQTSMLLSRLVHDMCWLIFNGLVEPRCLCEFRLPFSVAHDFLEGFGMRKGQFIRCDPNDVAVPLVHFQHIKWKSASS